MAVSAKRLGKPSVENAVEYLDELETGFRGRPKRGSRSQPKPVNAIWKYIGRAVTARMLRAVEERGL